MADAIAGATPADLRGLGAVNLAAAAPLTVSSLAYEASHIIKEAPGTCYGLSGYNSKGAAQFIQLFDSATVPPDGAIPLAFLTVPTVANFSIDFGVYGQRCTAGIFICNSSTGPTKTIGSADCFFSVRYR